jgi:hypothetical protein
VSAPTSVIDEIERLLNDGQRVVVTVAADDEMLSPQEAANRLRFSHQHVERLIGGGVLAAQRMPGSDC